jgi:hypothetical protein
MYLNAWMVGMFIAMNILEWERLISKKEEE